MEDESVYKLKLVSVAYENQEVILFRLNFVK